jgi:hypothetical protein
VLLLLLTLSAPIWARMSLVHITSDTVSASFGVFGACYFRWVEKGCWQLVAERRAAHDTMPKVH